MPNKWIIKTNQRAIERKKLLDFFCSGTDEIKRRSKYKTHDEIKTMVSEWLDYEISKGRICSYNIEIVPHSASHQSILRFYVMVVPKGYKVANGVGYKQITHNTFNRVLPEKLHFACILGDE